MGHFQWIFFIFPKFCLRKIRFYAHSKVNARNSEKKTSFFRTILKLDTPVFVRVGCNAGSYQIISL